MLPRDHFGMDNQQNALEPAFALLQEVGQCEWRLFVHFAFDEIECIALAECPHRKETVFGHWTIDTIVEWDRFFGTKLQIEKNRISKADKLIWFYFPTLISYVFLFMFLFAAESIRTLWNVHSFAGNGDSVMNIGYHDWKPNWMRFLALYHV